MIVQPLRPTAADPRRGLVRFEWPCGHHRTEVVLAGPYRALRPASPRVLAALRKEWDGAGRVYLGRCPTCSRPRRRK